jgi:hypothetical protein
MLEVAQVDLILWIVQALIFKLTLNVELYSVMDVNGLHLVGQLPTNTLILVQ